MLKSDIYGKQFSNYFQTAINAYSQVVKPRIFIDLLDSRHLSLSSNIANTDSHISSNSGSLGFYFNEKQMINGPERESFTWGVCNAKLKDGSTIKADGTAYAMPADLSDGYEYGFWSKSISQANGVFASSPVITFSFQQRKVNKIRITTSEYYGQVRSVRVRVINSNVGEIYNEILTFNDNEFYKESYIKTNTALAAQYNASQIELTILSTKNGEDCARIHEVNPIYELDITNRVDTFSVSRSRDVHESSLPVGGSESPKLNVRIDNTDKAWNVFNSSSAYGQYMKKDLKVSVASGWRIFKTDELFLNTSLSSNISNSSNTLNVYRNDIFPDDGPFNKFIVTIDPDNENREMILCEDISGDNQIIVSQRGFAGTTAKAHSVNAVVQFEPYEYVPMGTFYIDEWAANSSDMSVSFTASDWGKFLNEKTLNKGFMMENVLMGDAVKTLILMSNFPHKKYLQLIPYTDDAINYGAVAQYRFNESLIDRTGNLLTLDNGLRVRLWGMNEGREYQVKDIVADALDKELSQEDLAFGVPKYISPTAVYISSAISGSTYGPDATLSLQNYTFTGNDSITYTKYFNGVVDGYYIPLQSGNQNIELDIINGGAKIYLDDTLIASNWRNNKTLTTLSAYQYLGNFLNLTAGIPYKIRIEFFHADGDANFSMHLFKNNLSLNNKTRISKSETKTVVAEDSLGGLDAPFNTNVSNFNHHYNHAVYLSNTELGKSSEINQYEEKSVLLNDGGYIRIPNNALINLSEKDFTYEFIARFHQSHFSNSGEYLSSWANSSPSNGFEFFYNLENTHGFKVVTTSGVQIIQTTNTNITSSNFHHFALSYKANSKTLSYYFNGELIANSTISGNIVTQTSDITIGGRGASFVNNTGEIAPSETREFYMDDFCIYNKTLSSTDIKNRFISYKIQKLTKFKFLYDNDQTIRQTIDNITLADIGRFYLDEEDNARYEHYYRFFEPSIDQHANVQYLLSDSSNIIDADYQVQLQTNKVVVKVSSVDKQASSVESLWRADDPTTLARVTLLDEISANATEMFVSTTSDPVFFNNGYIVIDNEIIKYNGKTDNKFLSLERGMFDTAPVSHSENSKVREVRYYQVDYDKAPAYMIKSPFVTAINDEEPDLIDVLKFEPGPYTCKLIIAASNNVSENSIVYAEGTHPLTEKVYFTAIAGTPVVVSTNTQQVAEQVQADNENIRIYGLKELTIDSPYITDTEHAAKIANFIIEKTKDPVPILSINTMAVPIIQLGDRIRISSMNSFDIINGDYWVISQEFSYGSSISHTLTLRKVTQ